MDQGKEEPELRRAREQGGSPISVPRVVATSGPVTHFHTQARTKAIATAPLGLTTSWASSAALRHATGTSRGHQAGYFRAKGEGVGGPNSGPWAPCNGCPQRASAGSVGEGNARGRGPPHPGAAGWGRGHHAPPHPAPPWCACSLCPRSFAGSTSLGKSRRLGECR